MLILYVTIYLGDETRTIFAGIKKSYTPEQLIGKLVVVIANLKPRKMKFGVSNGMVLVFNASTNKFETTLDLTPGTTQNLDINGGSF